VAARPQPASPNLRQASSGEANNNAQMFTEGNRTEKTGGRRKGRAMSDVNSDAFQQQSLPVATNHSEFQS
jgi:hypothetical protein